jgi:3-oxoacyl-[acyl-carrier protein] reductase
MNLQLRAKRALVTGNSSGIGESIVRTLACEGVTVVVRGRNRERARRVGTAINQEGGRALVAIGDLATDDGASAVVQQTLEALGGPGHPHQRCGWHRRRTAGLKRCDAG